MFHKLLREDTYRSSRMTETGQAEKERNAQQNSEEKQHLDLAKAHQELVFQEQEKQERASELVIANKELAFQKKEKKNRATELAFNNAEKEKRASELLIANKELAYQNIEKEKRASELLIANKELAFQNDEKENRASELLIANKELAFQNEEKERRAEELISSNARLKKTEAALKQYIRGLEKMMFMTSHCVRQPVTQIIGIADILERSDNSPEQLQELIGFMKTAALSLDTFTKDLTVFMNKLETKAKKIHKNADKQHATDPLS